MENNPAKKIIEKIKEEHIVPESRFKLNWRNYAFWFVWSATMILGALFFSLIILNFLDIHLSIFRHFGLGRIFFVLMVTAPFLWIGLSVLALVSGFLAIRKTKRGYRYSMLFATSMSVLIISILGVMLHFAKINDRLGRGIVMGMPGHRGLAFPVEERWSRPEDNMLGGEVTQVQSDYIMIISFQDEDWMVYYSPETEIKVSQGKLETGMNVGVIGEKIGDKKFKAKFIHSFPERGSLFGKGRGPKVKIFLRNDGMTE